MNHILMITNADMSVQAGDVVLVSRRAEELFRQHDFTTTCMVMSHPSLEVNHHLPGIDYQTADERGQIRDFISAIKPEIIIFYGEMVYGHIPYVKRIVKDLDYRATLFLDIQGVLEEMVEYSKGIKLVIDYIKYIIKKGILYRAINKVDGALVVSDELKDYCQALLKKKRHEQFKFIKIRCGINEVISSGQKLEFRKEIRDYWGINDSTKVLVFSGYRKPWQNVDKIIQMFKHLDDQLDDVFFAFFCNLDDEFRADMARAFPQGNCFLKFLSFEEYFRYLCACDVGYLIRDYNVTNKVAFPNKFSDYLNAGLMVAMNQALPEPARVLKAYNMLYIDVEQDDENLIISKINQRQNNLGEFYARTEDLCQNELLFSAQIAKTSLNVDAKGMIAVGS